MSFDVGTFQASLERLTALLMAHAQEAPRAAAGALHREHEAIMTLAKQRTPVLTGALRGSGHVTPPVIEGTTVISAGGFGGPAAPYALFVHENLRAHHATGQSKFYESVLLERTAGLESRLAEDIERTLTGGTAQGGEEPVR